MRRLHAGSNGSGPRRAPSTQNGDPVHAGGLVGGRMG